ncbi:MAG: ATP-dependent helicase [Planctomycetota bacterium]
MQGFTEHFKRELGFLNANQREVVFSEPTNALVLAGPGSGKTQTIICRAGYLLVSQFFKPYNILLLTFTRKAAEEMNQRLLNLGIETGGLIRGTFHHFGNFVLTKYYKYAGLKPNFTIMDTDDQEVIIKNIIREFRFKEKKYFPKPREIIEVFTYACNTYTDLVTFLKNKEAYYLNEYLDDILKIKALYENYKKEYNLVDYDDLLLKTLILLKENQTVKEALSEKIKYILVDEFQDTSKLQWEILKTFISCSYIFAVGDDAQSIYGFRGANIGNIIEFKEVVPNCKIFTLIDNYRSSKEIVDFANAIIKLSSYVHPKQLRAQFVSYIKPVIIEAVDFNDEAGVVIEKIKYLVSHNDMHLRDIAVLYRKDFLSQSLQLKLIKENIPFEVRSGIKFTELAHIKDMLAFIKIIINPLDAISWQRILTKLPSIGEETAKKIIEFISKNLTGNIGPLIEKVIDSSASPAIKPSLKKLKIIFDYVDSSVTEKPYIILKYIVDNFYNEILLSEYDNFKKRYEDILGFINIAKNYESLNEFLSDITITNPVTAGYEFELKKNKKDYLILSTIHQAKGLEWKAVFIIGLIDGEIPDYRNIDDKFALDEELRLFYVGITRTKKFLYLTYPRSDSRTTLTKFLEPSRFLEKEYLPAHLYDIEYSKF